MDICRHRQTQRTVKPRSSLAEYIRGTVKLEDLVGKDKIVKPQERHNRAAFNQPLATINSIVQDSQQRLHRTKIVDQRSKSGKKSSSRSTSITCASSSLYSVHPTQEDLNDLERATSSYTTRGSVIDNAYNPLIIEKDREIAVLKKQVETLQRNFITSSAQNEINNISVETLITASSKISSAIDYLRCNSTDLITKTSTEKMDKEFDEYNKCVFDIFKQVTLLGNSQNELRKMNRTLEDEMVQSRFEKDALLKQINNLEEKISHIENEKEQLIKKEHELKSDFQEITIKNEALRAQQQIYKHNVGIAFVQISECQELLDQIATDFESNVSELISMKNNLHRQVEELQKAKKNPKETDDKYASTIEKGFSFRRIMRLRENERILRKQIIHFRTSCWELLKEYRELQKENIMLTEKEADYSQIPDFVPNGDGADGNREEIMKNICKQTEHSNKLIKNLEKTSRLTKLLDKNNLNIKWH